MGMARQSVIRFPFVGLALATDLILLLMPKRWFTPQLMFVALAIALLVLLALAAETLIATFRDSDER